MALRKILLVLLLHVIETTNLFSVSRDAVLLQNYSIVSTKIDSVRIPRSEDCSYFKVPLNQTPYKICVFPNTAITEGLLSFNPIVINYEFDGTEASNVSFFDMEINLVSGYVVGYKSDSDVEGYLENGSFYGRIHFGDTCYYVEDVHNFPEVIGKRKFYKDLAIIHRSSTREEFRKFQKRCIRYAIVGRICDITVVIDNSFVHKVAKHNGKTALALVATSLQRAETLYRSTDFNSDGLPDNIGFRVKQFLLRNQIVKYTTTPRDGNNYIFYASLQTHFFRNCLGILYTAQTFTDDVVGISYQAMATEPDYSGGICVYNGHQNFNVIVITYYSNGSRLPQSINDITAMHEIGHAFGAPHDPPNFGGYLMNSKTINQYTIRSFAFSNYSKPHINIILKRRGRCLAKEAKPFCGNSMVEANEECDCGSYYDCQYSDPCCFPPTSRNQCKVNRPKYKCHPNQGLCCTSECKIRNISYLGLNCENMPKMCNKTSENCGFHGRCINQQCQSVECTRIDLLQCSCSSKPGYCHICCLYHNNTCISSIDATSKQIAENPSLIANLKTRSHETIFSRGIYDTTRKYCREICVKLHFKCFKRDDFCLYAGQVGICNKHDRCHVENLRFMKTPVFSLGSSTADSTVLLIGLIFVYVYLIK